MVWENRDCKASGSCSVAAPRKFYDYEANSQTNHHIPEEETDTLIDYVAQNIIGKNTTFESPFGSRKVVYCDYTASGRSLSFIEDFIRNEILAHYGSTHNTDTNTALQTTMFRHEARDIIRSCVRASENDKVVLTGSGATGAVVRFLHCLDLKEAPVVLAGPFLHHSALLPWREAGATVIRIRESSEGLVDLSHLETTLRGLKTSNTVIGVFGAASNITGVLTDSLAVTVLLHRYGALAFWDYATAAPYVELDMNPVSIGGTDGLAHKDAMFFSLHKFVGGPQTPGVLVVKRCLLRHSVPTLPGGGTVFFVSRDRHRYLQGEEEREEGGTPSIVEDIRAGLVMQLKQNITAHAIKQRNEALARRLDSFTSSQPQLVSLGPKFVSADGTVLRLPILSFLVRHQQSGLFLHFKFVTALLNDVFGIQARGGCACAGPYALDLLGIDETMADTLHQALAEPSGLSRHDLRRRQEHGDSEVLRPGFVRLNLPYTASEEQVAFILSSVEWVCLHAWKLLPLYSFNPETGEWKHRKQQTMKGRQWLGNVSYKGGRFSVRHPSSIAQSAPDYSRCMDFAHQILADVNKLCRQYPDTASDELSLNNTACSLRWFLLPSEARSLLLASFPPATSPDASSLKLFKPVQYPLSKSVLQGRSDSVWKQPPRVHYWPHAPQNINQTDEKEEKTTLNEQNTSHNHIKDLDIKRLDISKNDGSDPKDEHSDIIKNVGPVDKMTSNVVSGHQVEVSSFLQPRKEEHCTDNSCFLPRPQTDLKIATVKAKWQSPPKQLFNPTVEAVKQFKMIRNGDRVLVCLSGGKDSLSLLHILHHYQFYARSQGVNFSLGAVTVDPESAAYDPRPLIPYLGSLGVEYLFEQQGILQQALELPDLNSICSFCSRMKRGRIYAAARRKQYNVLAFGQHLDDLAESFLMSVFHNGRLRTMKAAYTVQEEDLRVIRPLVFVREKHLRHFAESRKLPVIPENCPACFEVPKERHRNKQLLAQQELLFPTVYSSLRTAMLPLMSIAATGLENAMLGKQAFLGKGSADDPLGD